MFLEGFAVYHFWDGLFCFSGVWGFVCLGFFFSLGWRETKPLPQVDIPGNFHSFVHFLMDSQHLIKIITF